LGGGQEAVAQKAGMKIVFCHRLATIWWMAFISTKIRRWAWVSTFWNHFSLVLIRLFCMPEFIEKFSAINVSSQNDFPMQFITRWNRKRYQLTPYWIAAGIRPFIGAN
jgi:hypothetical protein